MENSRWRWFLPTLMATTALAKLLLAWRFPAFLNGDDVEVIETVARYAVGLSYEPWVLRSLFHTLIFVYPFVKAGALAGLVSAPWLAFLAAVPDVLASTVAIGLVHRVARDLGCAPAPARVAAFLYAVHWLSLAYGAMPYPRPISTALLLGAFLLAWNSGHGRRRLFAAGLLAACAFALRWSEGLFLAPLAGVVWSKERRAAPLAALLAGFAMGTLLTVGLFDWVTWGAPFASLAAFARYVGEPTIRPKPWFYYGSTAFRWAGPVWPMLLLLSWRDRRSRIPLAVSATMLALFTLAPSRELHYLLIWIPFLAVAAALGWEVLSSGPRWRRALGGIALAGAAVWGFERTWALMNRKSQSALEAARFLKGLEPAVRTVVLEQMWAYGEKLYLGDAVTIRDLIPDGPLRPTLLEEALPGADAVALYDRDVRPEISRLLARGGFTPCRRLEKNWSLAVTVYLPADRPCPGP
jgi:phosphatidylinositol glycan class B